MYANVAITHANVAITHANVCKCMLMYANVC